MDPEVKTRNRESPSGKRPRKPRKQISAACNRCRRLKKRVRLAGVKIGHFTSNTIDSVTVSAHRADLVKTQIPHASIRLGTLTKADHRRGSANMTTCKLSNELLSTVSTGSDRNPRMLLCHVFSNSGMQEIQCRNSAPSRTSNVPDVSLPKSQPMKF
jgi:hypothetical protein